MKPQTISRIGLTRYFRNHPHQGGIIVCESKKFIYMKAAKTAGTSILRGVLEKQIEGVIHQKDHPEKFDQWLDKINDEQLAEYFIFSVTRNPWDRAVSFARYFDTDLIDFVQKFFQLTKEERIRSHTLPISNYTHNEGRLFADMVCRFECLQADMNLVFDRIGIPRQRLPFLNPSNRKHYQRYYDQSSIDFVSNFYKEDIKNFGYMYEKICDDNSFITAAFERIASTLAAWFHQFRSFTS